jgi:hypothetical protein
MTVSADHRCAWQGKALLWANDMYNALTLVIQTEVGKTKVFDILFESNALCS